MKSQSLEAQSHQLIQSSLPLNITQIQGRFYSKLFFQSQESQKSQDSNLAVFKDQDQSFS